MSTHGQFSTKSPTIKRILKEASELANSPSSDYHAVPLESDLFEWHFTLRGPPSPSPFAGGTYHGRIVLPPAYPLKPPSFRFLTPSGRFEVNREICLSISGHHEETWQPAWGIRTALVAIRSFMDTDAGGQLGGMDASKEVRTRMAGQSRGWRCGTCGKRNEEIMEEVEQAVREHGAGGREEVVPQELRLAYRDDLRTKEGAGSQSMAGVKEANGKMPDLNPSVATQQPTPAPVSVRPQDVPEPAQRPITTAAQQNQQRATARQDDGVPPWIDKAIYGVLLALLYVLWRRFG